MATVRVVIRVGERYATRAHCACIVGMTVIMLTLVTAIPLRRTKSTYGDGGCATRLAWATSAGLDLAQNEGGVFMQ